MGFFHDKPGKKRRRDSKPTGFDKAMAAKLRKHIGKGGAFISRDKTKWASQFCALRKSLIPHHGEKAAKEIKTVLMYFIANSDKRTDFPTVSHGKDFKDRFEWIKAVREKNSTESKPMEGPLVGVFARTVQLGWPAKAEDQLPRVINETYDNYRELWAKLLAGHPFNTDDIWYKNAHRHVATTMPNPVRFTEEWIQKAHAKIRNWPDWDGNLIRYSFNRVVAAEVFEKEVYRRLTEYMGDARKTTERIIKGMTQP